MELSTQSTGNARMPISSEEMEIGWKAQEKIRNYTRHRSKRFWIYLFPALWLLNAVVRYVAERSSWNLFQVAFWVLALLVATLVDHSRERSYLNDFETLQRLKKLYGADVSFEKEVVQGKREVDITKSTKARDKWNGLYPLFAFAVFLIAIFTLPYLLHLISIFFSRSP